MSVQSTHVPAGVAHASPTDDLADVWLAEALALWLDATEGEQRDAYGRSVVAAALAVEARVNRVLARCDDAERQALARLAPAERFRLAPRLLDDAEAAIEGAALADLVDDVFAVREGLVAGPSAVDREQEVLDPVRARSLLAGSAAACGFLARLAGEEPATARLVGDVVELGSRPAGTEAIIGWNGNSPDAEFPPDIIGS